MVKEVDERTEAYMPTLLAMELVDPSASNANVLPVAASTWDAMKSLVDRCGANVGGIDFRLLKRQIQDWRDVTAVELSPAEKHDMRKNLLRYFYRCAKADDAALASLQADVDGAKTEELKAAAQATLEVFKPLLPSEIRKFARIVFLYPVTSVIVEGLFSHMTYNQAGSRRSLGDDRCADVIACKDFVPVDADATTFLLPPEYDWDSAIAETNNLAF